MSCVAETSAHALRGKQAARQKESLEGKEGLEKQRLAKAWKSKGMQRLGKARACKGLPTFLGACIVRDRNFVRFDWRKERV